MSNFYHYTDLNAFLSIIKNKKLWLSGTNNLNDHQELHWAASKIVNILSERKAGAEVERAELIWMGFKRMFTQYYICSFSTSSDLLSQWRAYGQDGAGVAIGFSRASFPEMSRPPYLTASSADNTSFSKVIYSEREQEEIIRSFIEPSFKSPALDQNTHMAISTACSELASYMSIFKNPAFSEENEWRLIHRPMIMGFEGKRMSIVNQSVSQPQFRVSNNKIVTYFEFPLDKAPSSDYFLEIVLGPKCEISEHDLRIFLTSNNLPEINISMSKASYR